MKHTLRKYYVNLRGWKTPRKIVVIESDDWGSVRISSRQARDKLLKEGIAMDANNFTMLDGLERTGDLESLFEVLSSFKDSHEHHPSITANSLVANPDFKAIAAGDFSRYEFEQIKETYNRYGEPRLMPLWKEEGIPQNLLYPQFHGREHLHYGRWLRQLRTGNEIELKGFEKESLLGIRMGNADRSKTYMAAFEYQDEKDKKLIEETTVEGLEMFKATFGFSSLSFIASQSIWGRHLDKVLYENGVRYNQGGQHLIPEDGKLKQVNHWWGESNEQGIIYWRRNCMFEPYKSSSTDHVANCLKEIDIAFKCGKPAVISSHRVNFTSRIETGLRDRSLSDLKSLLSQIIMRWPDVEFMNSEQLGDLITESTSK